MQARVFVSLKPTVLDPQGQTIRSALSSLGHSSIVEVRQSKFFDITYANGVERAQIQADLEALARDVLTNPVIEDYWVEFPEER